MSVDVENLKKLLQDCKNINCAYVKKHNELKEVVKDYKRLVNEVKEFELFNSNISDILNNSDFLNKEKMQVMKDEQSKIITVGGDNNSSKSGGKNDLPDINAAAKRSLPKIKTLGISV